MFILFAFIEGTDIGVGAHFCLHSSPPSLLKYFGRRYSNVPPKFHSRGFHVTVIVRRRWFLFYTFDVPYKIENLLINNLLWEELMRSTGRVSVKRNDSWKEVPVTQTGVNILCMVGHAHMMWTNFATYVR